MDLASNQTDFSNKLKYVEVSVRGPKSSWGKEKRCGNSSYEENIQEPGIWIGIERKLNNP